MIKLINKLKNRKGFTLIELIVVLAVLAIIMAIAVPRFTGVREQAKIDSDYATLESIAKLAEFDYVRNNDETVTTLDSTEVLELINANFGDPTDLFQSIALEGTEGQLTVNYDTGYVDNIMIGTQEVYPTKLTLGVGALKTTTP